MRERLWAHDPGMYTGTSLLAVILFARQLTFATSPRKKVCPARLRARTCNRVRGLAVDPHVLVASARTAGWRLAHDARHASAGWTAMGLGAQRRFGGPAGAADRPALGSMPASGFRLLTPAVPGLVACSSSSLSGGGGHVEMATQPDRDGWAIAERARLGRDAGSRRKSGALRKVH